MALSARVPRPHIDQDALAGIRPIRSLARGRRAPYRPVATAAPPAPSQRVVRALAVSAFEVLEGMRTVAQLGPWVTEGVARQLRERRALRTELRSLTRDTRRAASEPGRAHMTRSGAALEAVVVLHATARAHAVALRFEIIEDRWRATDVTVL